ncbi:MAG: hypothetical protein ACU841_06820 [Gammaproteobacteria bacterium]
MTRQFVLGLIKFLLMSAPLLSMVMMVLALWGVVGKASYSDLDARQPDIAMSRKEGKNYLASETKPIARYPEALESSETEPARENPRPTRIDWERVI